MLNKRYYLKLLIPLSLLIVLFNSILTDDLNYSTLRRVHLIPDYNTPGLTGEFIRRLMDDLNLRQAFEVALDRLYPNSRDPRRSLTRIYNGVGVILRIAQDLPQYQNRDLSEWLSSDYGGIDLNPVDLEVIEDVAEYLATDRSELFETIRRSIDRLRLVYNYKPFVESFEIEDAEFISLGENDFKFREELILPQQILELNVFKHEADPETTVSKVASLGSLVAGDSIVAVLSGGRVMSKTPQKGKIRIWDLNNHKAYVLRGEKDISAVIYLPDGRLVTGDTLGMIRIWDFENNSVKIIEDEDRQYVTGLAVTESGKLISTNSAGRINIWDLSARKVETIAAQEAGYLNILSDGRIVTVSMGNIKIWDLDAKSVVLIKNEESPLSSTANIITAFTVLPDGRLLSADYDGFIKLWDIKKSESSLLHHFSRRIYTFTLLPDGRIVSTGEKDMAMLVWNLGRNEYEETQFTGICKVGLIGENSLVVDYFEGFPPAILEVKR